MLGYLKQATASQSRMIGPFLDDTDFKTAETGLTIANTDIKLSANGGAAGNKNSGGGTHRSNGMYGVTFDATDTATVGELSGTVVVSGALPVYFKFVVLEEVVYAALFEASALGYVANAPVNVAQFGGSNLTAASGIPDVNTVKVGGTTQTARDIGASVLLSSGTGTGQILLTSGRVSIVGNIRKNTAFAGFEFMLTDDTTHAPYPGALNLVATRSIDGGAFGTGTLGTPTGISAGAYYIDFGAGDLNGNNVVLRVTADDADDTFVHIITSAA